MTHSRLGIDTPGRQITRRKLHPAEGIGEALAERREEGAAAMAPASRPAR